MRHALFLAVLLAGLGGFSIRASAAPADSADRFIYLSQHTSSSCAGDFPHAISLMPKDSRITGSCCSPMNKAHYAEQIEGLKKYKDIKDIPPDPYDIEAELAAQMIADDGIVLTPDEQKAYDYAMANSHEKGPCCCKCWHWKAYSGLAKNLIRNNHYTGRQVTEVWDLSDGCGGADDDHDHG